MLFATEPFSLNYLFLRGTDLSGLRAISILAVSESISSHQNRGNAVGRPGAVIVSMLKLINLSLSRHHAAAGSVAVTGAPC
jgi:hypothetical protein